MSGTGAPTKTNNATIKIYHECEGGVEKSFPKITDWHHEAYNCLVLAKKVILRDEFFYPILKQTMNYFSCSQFNSAFLF